MARNNQPPKKKTWEDIGSGKVRHDIKLGIEQYNQAVSSGEPAALPEPVPAPVPGETPTEGTNAAEFSWETAATANVEPPLTADEEYNQWLKEHPAAENQFIRDTDYQNQTQLGYGPTYWQDPKRVARYYNAIKATPVGATLPEWMTPEFQQAIIDAYEYMDFRNEGTPWTEWKYLNPADKGLEYLAALPPPPPEFLWPEEEKFAQEGGAPGAGGPTIENVMAGEAAWGDLPEEQRAAILKAPDFDLAQFDPMVRQQMLSDPNFNWEALPAWQQTLFKLQSNPIIGGAVQGFMMGGMSLKGAGIGMGIGWSAGMIGYNPNKWFYEQGNGDGKMQLGEVGSALLGLLNDLGQLMEVGFGYAAQVGDAALGGRPDVAMSLLTDPVQREAALRAARVAYESSPIATWATNAVIGVSNIFTKEDQRYIKPGEQIVLGKADPVELMPGVDPKLIWYKAMGEARKEIAAAIENGEDPQAVMDGIIQEWSGYAGAPIADLAMQATFDPLNVLPGMSADVEAKILGGQLGKIGEEIGRPEIGKALEGAANPTEVAKTFSALVGGLPAEKVGELPAASRWLAGYNENGEKTAGWMGLYPSETMTSTKINPAEKVGLLGMGAKSWDSWARHMFTLAPEARANLAGKMALNNIGAIAAHLTIGEFDSFFTALQNMDMVAAKNIAGEVVGSAEFYTILPMLKGFDLNEIKTTMWDLTAENRGLLNRIAEILGQEPGRVVRDLGKRDSAARAFETIRQLVSKSKDAAGKALLGDMNAGRFTVGDLEAIGKTFNGPDALPWHEAQFQAFAMGALEKHVEKWGAAHFGLNPGSFGVQLARTLKGVQSLILLGYNPGYVINNVVNNEATMAFSGMFNTLSMKDVSGWTERLGWTPERIKDTGLFGENLNKTSAIADAMRSKGVMGALNNFTQKFNQASVMPLAGKMEGMQGARGMTAAMMQAWGRFWERGKGFREMSPELKSMLRSTDPSLAEHVYNAIEGGMNEREIMDALGGRQTGIRAQSLVENAAKSLGMDKAGATDFLRRIGVLDALDGMLKNADTPEKRNYAFSQMDKRIQSWIDARVGQELQGKAEHIATAINGEGENRFFEVVLDTEGMLFDRWVEHYMKADEVASQMEQIGDEFQGQKSLLWLNWYRSDLAEYARADASALANYKGIISALGLESPEAQRLITLTAEKYATFNEAYKFRLQESSAYYDKWQGQFTLDTIDARMADVDAMQARVDAKFQEAFKRERVLNEQFRDLLVEQVRLKYGDAVAEQTRRAYQQTLDFRAEMVSKLQEHRKGMKNLYGADRRAANAKFYNDIYQPRIHEARRLFEDGVGEVQRGMGGESPIVGESNSPIAPPSAPVAPMKTGSPLTVETSVGKVDFGTPVETRPSPAESGAGNLPPGPLPAGKGSNAAEVWKIASENGMSGVDGNGNQVFGAKLDIIKFVKKWGGSEGGQVVRFEDITPEIMQKAVDSRKAWQDAQIALPKIEASQVEGLKVESEALKEPTKGATEASEKALGKAESDLTPDPFPVGKGSQKSAYDLVHDKAVSEHIADLEPAVRDALQYELSVMRDMVATGEPGQRLFSKTEGFIGATESSYPSWYGPLKGKKADVLFALEALTKGLDKPEQALYRNLKGIAAALLNDDVAISERWDWAKAWGLEDEILYRVDRKISDVTSRVLAGAAEGNYEALHRGWAELADVMGEIPKEVMSEKVRVIDMETGKRVPTAETYAEYTNRLWDEMEALYNSGTAEHLNAVAELKMRDAQAQGEMVMTRELLREQLSESVPDATPEQVSMALDLVDARAETWAAQNGRMPAEWYAERIAPMVSGTYPPAPSQMGRGVDLMQGGRIEPVNRRMTATELNDYARALVRAGESELRSAVRNEPNRVDRIAILDAAHALDPKMAEAVAGKSMDMLYQEGERPSTIEGMLDSLHNAKARVKGFDIAIDSEVKRFFKEMRDASYNKNLMQGGDIEPGGEVRKLIDDAENAYYSGDYKTATEKSETALTFIHERADLQHYPQWLYDTAEDMLFQEGNYLNDVNLQEARDGYRGLQERPEWIDKAIARFGLTADSKEAGYILPDGRMLDFSGKNEGGRAGYRSFDHRQISESGVPEINGKSLSPMTLFSEGTKSLRFDIRNGDVYVNSFSTVPTPEQVGVIIGALKRGSELFWDVTDTDGRVILSDSVTNANAEKVMALVDKTTRIFEGKETAKELGGDEMFNQEAKGGVSFLEDGRAIIHAFEGADVSTIVHEIGHIFRRDLSAVDLKVAEDWAGVKDGVWTRAAEEKFARGFEEYLAEGKAPTAKLKAVFAKFKEWMVSIYRVITGSAIDVKLTPEMRGVFDRLLAEAPPPAPPQMGTFGEGGIGVRIAEMGREAGAELYPQMKAGAENVDPAPHAAFQTLEEFRSGVTVEKDGRGRFVVVQDSGMIIQKTTVEGVSSADAAIRKLYETRKRAYEEMISRPASGFYEEMKANQEALKNAYAEPSKYVAWEDAQTGDLIAEGKELVQKGIKTKKEAQALAAEVGGEVMGDGAKKWAVVKNLTPSPFPTGKGSEPAMLFQSADPRMPLGGVDQASGYMPEGAMLDEAYASQIRPLLEAMREEAGKMDNGSWRMENLTPEARAGLTSYIKQVVKNDMPATKLATVRYGEGMRDFAMLNYSKKYGFDKYILDPAVPYQFFMTRTGGTWLTRAVDRPAIFANMARLQRFSSRYRRDLPERLKDKLKIELPFLPEWMGGAIYIDPMKQIFAPLMFLQPFEQMQKDKNAQIIEAERVLQEWAQDETYSAEEVARAAQTRAGSVWEAALAEASLRRKAEIASPLDFITTLLSPSWFLTTPYKLLTGKGNEIGQLPITRTAQAIETAGKGTWAEPLTNLAGMFARPENWVREKLNLPQYGEYGEYYIKRQIANMVAEGLATPEEGTMAIYEGRGPVYDQAVERVRQELMMRVPLASALYAGLHDGPMAAAQTLPSSLFGAGILPEGELKYRGLFKKWGAVWESRDRLMEKFNGDEAAMKQYLQQHPEQDMLKQFFEDHPEYEVYLLSKKDNPEEQLKKFLTSQIWDSYMGLDKATRKIVTAQLGPLFEHSFLNSETRSPDSLDLQTLARWSMMLGNAPPRPSPNSKNEFGEGAWPTPGSVPTLEGLPVGTVGPMAQYDAEKARQFPHISELQNLYFESSDADRARILTIYPQIKAYWDWRREYMLQHPEVAPFLDSETAKGIIDGTLDARNYGMSQAQAERLIGYYNNEFQTPIYTADYYLENASPLLMEVLSAHQLMGTPLTEGASKELYMIWEGFGKPGDSFDIWLNDVIYATMGY